MSPVSRISEEDRTPSARSVAPRILDDALVILRERRGLDFSGYRRGTIERRLANRMVAAHAGTGEAYLSLLRESDTEVDRLATNLTIKVSRFYRNASAFDFLSNQVIPALRSRFAGQALRTWSAGCAAGEEAYTLAMLLTDADEDVCASDIDESALVIGRAGRYPAGAFSEAPGLLAGKLVQPDGDPGMLRVADALRKRVRFVRHDLGRDQTPPGGRGYHLILCRNVLIYFGRQLQQHALALLVESLLPGGVLCLGEAEWPTHAISALEVLDRRNRVFRRREAKETAE